MIGINKEGANDSVAGITRLQKLLFLFEREFEPKSEILSAHFAFEPYKAGPYSSKMYDELEFLENLGLIESEVIGQTTEAEAEEIDKLNFEDLISSEEPNNTPRSMSDSYVERNFKLTEAGKSKIEELVKSGEYEPFIDGIRKVKSKFGKISLNDLLYYVYTNYPEMTVESEIKDRVLSRRR